MESWQREHIRRKLPELIRDTKCNALFMAKLRADGLLTEEEVDLVGTTKVKTAQATKLYDIIQTRTKSFNCLKQALQETFQTGASAILDECTGQDDDDSFKTYGKIVYNKDAVIGTGCSNTKVYSGKLGDRDIAVKAISIRDINPAPAMREAKLLEKLDWHVNIIRIFTVEVTSEHVLIALELCDSDLHAWVMKPDKGKLQIGVLDIINQATEGIAHLHANNVAHRDLEPANILLVCHATGQVRVKIADFGMSNRIPDGSSMETVHSSVAGTLGWMAPEFMAGQLPEAAPSAGFASDIFSLGCVYYFLLSEGVHPFGDNPFWRLTNIMVGRADLSQDKIKVIKDGSFGYITLISKMIKHNQRERPSAPEVLIQLSQLRKTQRPEEVTADHSPRSNVNLPVPSEEEISSGPSPKMDEGGPAVNHPKDKAPVLNAELTETNQPKLLNDGDKEDKPQLHLAVIRKDIQAVQQLIQLGADVNHKSADFKTPLILAASGDDINVSSKIIKCLIENGANVTAVDKDGQTFLHRFISEGARPSPSEFHSMAEYLVGKGYSNVFNKTYTTRGRTPLHFAVEFLEPEERTLSLLHTNGVNFNAVDVNGDSILGTAIWEGRSAQIIHTLVARFGAEPTKLDSDENSLLHLVAKKHSSDALKYFLDLRLEGLDINGKNKFGNTPLHFLLRDSDIEVLEKCRLLLSYGADVNSTNKRQQTPLHYATCVKDKEVALKTIKFLLENGADPLAKDEYNRTFLHLYLSTEHLRSSPSHFHSLVEYLLSKNYSEIFDIPEGRFGLTPLHLMVCNMEPEEKTMSLLHSRAVNFNAVDNDGYSVLRYAIYGKRSTKFLSNLVNRFGADPKHLNNNGLSMLHHAAYFRTAEALKLFLEYDLDINKKTIQFGNTPLHLAVHPKSEKIDVLEKCRLLVGKGADVNIVTKEGYTPVSLVMTSFDGADKEELKKLLKRKTFIWMKPLWNSK